MPGETEIVIKIDEDIIMLLEFIRFNIVPEKVILVVKAVQELAIQMFRPYLEEPDLNRE
jgi:hypothetical protein